LAVMLIARFDGDVDQLRRAYDRAHALIMSRGGATGVGELRHHCAIGEGALYIIGVWESEERVRTRWANDRTPTVQNAPAARPGANLAQADLGWRPAQRPNRGNRPGRLQTSRPQCDARWRVGYRTCQLVTARHAN
jgi:hypothetical protein